MESTNRYRASQASLGEFTLDEILVECPACKRCAVTREHALPEPAKSGRMIANSEGRLVCLHCSHNERRAAFVRYTNGACDTVFRLPVWLHTRCCGRTLWAYNGRHLDAIEAFIQSGLRERRRDPKLGWRNKAWTSRMPAWMRIAKNRDEVLRCIARLRKEKLPPGR